MNLYNRRNFVKISGSIAGALFAGSLMSFKKKSPLLSFSTLGCPDWTFTQITDFAVANNYTGLEIRGLLREMDLTKCPEFKKENIAVTKKMMTDKRISFVNLGSSATMHYKDANERQKNLDAAKQFIDLAHELDCPYIRVFPNNFPQEQDRNETIDLIIDGLKKLGTYAKGSNVKVLMETHGDLVWTADIVKIMQSAGSENTGLIWDIANMWNITKEKPADVYPQIKKYIHHTHIKDNTLVDDKISYKLLGKGVVPIFEGIDLLYKDGYKGYYSFEWEKLWHPEIDAPEIAVADYPRAMQQHFSM
ncbi:sugar phosphate isomerase/epimerase [soil metagenome]